jgi:membrane protease YdiL (CAAX protease family)
MTSTGHRIGERRRAALDLLILISFAAIVIILVPVGRAAIGGSVGLKLLFLSRMVILLFVATGLLHRNGRGWRDLGLRRPPVWRSVAIVPVGLLVIGVLVGGAKALLARAGYAGADYAAFAPLRGHFAEYLFWLLPVTIGSAAFGEEMIFRGFVRDRFECLMGGTRLATGMAILCQAIVFSLGHAYQGAGGVITTFLVGFLLGVVWWIARRNLWPGIILHAILDGSALTAIYLGLPIS